MLVGDGPVQHGNQTRLHGGPRRQHTCQKGWPAGDAIQALGMLCRKLRGGSSMSAANTGSVWPFSSGKWRLKEWII